MAGMAWATYRAWQRSTENVCGRVRRSSIARRGAADQRGVPVCRGLALTAGAPIHRALVEPVLIAGMERKLAIEIFGLVGVLVLGPGLHIYTLALAACLLPVATYGLRKLAAYDPRFEETWMRYSQYQAVYEAEAPARTHKSFFGRSRVLLGRRRPAVPTPKEMSGWL